MRFAVYHNLFVFVNLSFPYIIALVSFLIIEQFQQSFSQGRKPNHKDHYKHPSLKLQTNKSIFTYDGLWDNIDKLLKQSKLPITLFLVAYSQTKQQIISILTVYLRLILRLAPFKFCNLEILLKFNVNSKCFDVPISFLLYKIF